MSFFFNPKKVAVIGATANPRKFGNVVTQNILSNKNRDYEVFLVSLKKQNLNGIRLSIVILLMSAILGYNTQSYSATELEEVKEQINQHMTEVVKAKKNCDEVCAAIAIESEKFFLANSANEIYLDDQNEYRMPDYIVWDGKLGYTYGPVGINFSVRNIFDTEYYTMGYNLNGANYFFPMAQRNILAELLLNF